MPLARVTPLAPGASAGGGYTSVTEPVRTSSRVVVLTSSFLIVIVG